MKTSAFLAFGVWCVLFVFSIVGLTRFDPPYSTGIIVLERMASCDFIVVRSNDRFYMLDVGDYLVEVAGGQEIVGPFARSGEQIFRVDGRTSVTARVRGEERDLLQASARLDRDCGVSPVRRLLRDNSS